MSHLSGSNQRPTDYKSVALPAELKWHDKERIFFTRKHVFSAKRTAKVGQRIEKTKPFCKKNTRIIVKPIF